MCVTEFHRIPDKYKFTHREHTSDLMWMTAQYKTVEIHIEPLCSIVYMSSRSSLKS